MKIYNYMYLFFALCSPVHLAHPLKNASNKMLVHLVAALALQCHHHMQLVNISEFIHKRVIISAHHLPKQVWSPAFKC